MQNATVRGLLAESAKGDASATRLRANAEADATRAIGGARADAYRNGVAALGANEYGALLLTTTLAENHVKIVPDIAVAGSGCGAGLSDALLARLLARPAAATITDGAGPL